MAQAKPISIFDAFECDQKVAFKKLNDLYDVLQRLRYEGKIQTGKNSRELSRLLVFFKEDLIAHIREEEKVLFPFLKTHIPKLEPVIRLLLSEHEDCRETLKELLRSYHQFETSRGRKPGVVHQIYEQGIYFICLVRSHLWVESQNLYKVADRELHVAEKKRIVAYAGRR